MKKGLAVAMAALLGVATMGTTAMAAASGDITICSREDGSGTRGAFIELFGIEEKQGDEKVDMTTEDASITNSTSVMMTTVAGDENAIGYISLGSLNDTVKAVKIDGAEASAENVANDTYKVSRPFNIITTDKLSDAAQDFENYIMSADGQQIVEDNGYIKVADDAKAYEQSDAEGKVVVAGSSSVTPVMEKLKEAYEKANGGKITVEVQQSDSTTGITSAAEGICDIGMASRDLKDDETAAANHIYQKDGAKDGQAEIAIAGNLTLTEEGYTLGKYDETGDLSQMLSEQILSAMTGADALFLNQEFSISSKGEALSGKTSILHANAERMNILEALGADVVSLGNEHAAGYGQDALKENMELLKNAGMAYVGAGTDAADAAQPVYLIINGIKIGFTSASGMEDSYDMAAGDGKAGILEYTEAEQYTKVIQEAATKCDYLIVYDHEGKGDANGVESYQKEHAAAFLQAGADIVIGGHSDRLQGIEYIDGKPVVYSIGSVLTDGTSRYSAVLKLNITSEGLKEMSLVPGIQTEDMTEYLDSTETQKKMYDAVAALCPNASIDENGVVTEKK